MTKSYFHNYRSTSEIKNEKRLSQTLNVETQNAVNINILLNRVKIEKKNETRRKIFFFSFTTFSLILFAIFVTIIN